MIRRGIRHFAVPTLAATILAVALPGAVTAADQAPDVSTGSINSIDRTDATFTGSVNPHGTATTYVFQYGRTTAYGASTTATSAGSGTSSTSVSKQVGGLTAGTTYHVRLVATNGGGTVNGADRSFTTDKPAPVAAPAVSTGGATSVTQTTATLTARAASVSRRPSGGLRRPRRSTTASSRPVPAASPAAPTGRSRRRRSPTR